MLGCAFDPRACFRPDGIGRAVTTVRPGEILSLVDEGASERKPRRVCVVRSHTATGFLRNFQAGGCFQARGFLEALGKGYFTFQCDDPKVSA